jgi:hypothetical protein
MPFKSQAQRRKFAQLLVEGKISPQTFEEWNRETGSAKLPDHVKRRAKRRTTKRATKSRTSTTGTATRGAKKRTAKKAKKTRKARKR